MIEIATSLQEVLKIVLNGRLSCAYKRDELMRDYTSFKIGGPVRLMFFPKNMTELAQVYDLLREHEIRPLILGRGTNLLVDDKPLDMVVINTLGLNNIEFSACDCETKIVADAGVGLNTLAMFALNHGLTGLEFAHGIPGTLGGGIKMNAGAYDGDINNVIHSTIALNFEAGLYNVHGKEHDFGYRCSRFTNTDDIITSATLKLKKDDPINIKAKMDELSRRRTSSQPLDVPSAGSAFKRPKQGYAAALIDKAGLKGYKVGGAQISEKHAGFIVNSANATFSDVVAVLNHAQQEVFRQFGVKLEPEIKIVRS